MTLLCALLTLICLQEPAEPSEDAIAAIAGELHSSVRMELSRVRRLVELSDQQSVTIADVLEKPIRTAAVRYAKQGALGLNRPTVLDQELSSLIGKQIRRMRGANAEAKYSDDVAARRSFWMAALLDGSIVVIDYRVSLTADQARRIRMILATQWQSADQYWLGAMNRELKHELGKGAFPIRFPVAAVRDELTDLQQQAWDLHKARLLELQSSPPPLTPEDYHAAAVSELKWLPRIARVNALILAEHTRASEAQKRQLVLAAKSASQSARALRMKSLAARRANESPTISHWETGAASLPELVLCYSDWARRARSVLDEPQRRVFDLSRRNRARRAHDALIRYVLAHLSRMAPFTAREQAEAFDLLGKAPIDQRGCWLSAGYYRYFLSISRSEWQAVLSEEPLSALIDWQTRIKQTVPGMSAGNEQWCSVEPHESRADDRVHVRLHAAFGVSKRVLVTPKKTGLDMRAEPRLNSHPRCCSVAAPRGVVLAGVPPPAVCRDL